MRIVSWNCNGGFRKKFEKIEKLNADIIVIQECENPEVSQKLFDNFRFNKFIWDGNSKNKGISIFFKEDLLINKLEWNNSYQINIPDIRSDKLKWNTSELNQFLTISINEKLNLIGVWTKGGENKDLKYIGQFWKFILANKENILEKPTIIIGDFNSNAKWDKIDRWWNHSEVIKILDSWNYKSLYHEKNNEEQGNELTPTFFLQRKFDKSYHIDYTFLPNQICKDAKIEIGKFEDWISLSDHMPLIIDLKMNLLNK
jgi:exonuclease III